MAAQWRWMVATFLPSSARCVAKPATVTTLAGKASRPSSRHQVLKRFQSPAYARLVAVAPSRPTLTYPAAAAA